MAEEQKTKLRLEIAHVLFIDIVGYSKLTTEEQSEALPELNQIVRNTEAAREGEAAGHVGAHGHPGHVLDPAGDHGVVRPRHHALRGEVGGLLRGAALAVDCGAGDRLGQACGQPGVPGDVGGLLAHL